MIRTRSGLTVQPLRRSARNKEDKPKAKTADYETEEEVETDEVDEGDEEELNEQHLEPTPIVRPVFSRVSSNGPELLARKPSRSTQTSPSPQRTGAAVDLRRRSPAPAKLASGYSKTLPSKGFLPAIDETPKVKVGAMPGPAPPASASSKRWILILLVLMVACAVPFLVYGTHLTEAFFQTTCSWQPDIEEALARESDHGLLSSQPPLTRKQLFELPLHAEKTAPKRPICIVSASLDPNGQAGRHLAMGLAPKLFTSSSRLFEISSSSYSDWAPDEMDRDLTRRIDRHFLHCGKGMLMIKDFDTLPDPHRLLWRLCDDDHPLFPEAVILLAASPQLLERSGIAIASSRAEASVQADADLASDSGYRALGQRLRVALADKWRSNYNERAFDPLWSRIANLVIFFR